MPVSIYNIGDCIQILNVAHEVAAVGFFSRYPSGSLPYVRRRHITVNNTCSFLYLYNDALNSFFRLLAC